jgi:hypothetical protein
MKKLFFAVAFVLVAGTVIAATTWDMSWPRFDRLWIGDTSDTPTATLGANSAYIKGDLEVDGSIYADGGVDSVTRTIYFDIGAAVVDSGNDVDDASAPNITTKDNVPAIVWDDSGETVGVQWSFPAPADYSTGMVFYAMVSSDDASGAATALDWALIKNADDTGFGSVTAQSTVTCTSATLDASNEILTLTPDAPGAALFVDGAAITIEVFNASTNDDDLELKALWGEYTATK